MRTIMRGLGGGKTTELLKILEEDPQAVFFAHSEVAASSIVTAMKRRDKDFDENRIRVAGKDTLKCTDPKEHAVVDNVDGKTKPFFPAYLSSFVFREYP